MSYEPFKSTGKIIPEAFFCDGCKGVFCGCPKTLVAFPRNGRLVLCEDCAEDRV